MLTFIQIAEWSSLSVHCLVSKPSIKKTFCFNDTKSTSNAVLHSIECHQKHSCNSSRRPAAHNYHRDCPSTQVHHLGVKSQTFIEVYWANAGRRTAAKHKHRTKARYRLARREQCVAWYASTHTHLSLTQTTQLSPPTAAPQQFHTVAVRFAVFANLALPTKLHLCHCKLPAA